MICNSIFLNQLSFIASTQIMFCVFEGTDSKQVGNDSKREGTDSKPNNKDGKIRSLSCNFFIISFFLFFFSFIIANKRDRLITQVCYDVKTNKERGGFSSTMFFAHFGK